MSRPVRGVRASVQQIRLGAFMTGARIVPGDHILEIDGKSVAEMSVEKAAQSLVGTVSHARQCTFKFRLQIEFSSSATIAKRLLSS